MAELMEKSGNHLRFVSHETSFLPDLKFRAASVIASIVPDDINPQHYPLYQLLKNRLRIRRPIAITFTLEKLNAAHILPWKVAQHSESDAFGLKVAVHEHAKTIDIDMEISRHPSSTEPRMR